MPSHDSGQPTIIRNRSEFGIVDPNARAGGPPHSPAPQGGSGANIAMFPVILWGGHPPSYRVYEMGKAELLPPPYKMIAHNKGDVCLVPAAFDLVLLGEARGGANTYVDWLRVQLNECHERCVMVNLADGLCHPRFYGEFTEKERGLAQAALKALLTPGATADRVEHMLTWLKGLDKPTHLILKHLSALLTDTVIGSENLALDVCIALRSLRDLHGHDYDAQLKQLRIHITSESTEPFEDGLRDSGYQKFCHFLRLPHLDTDDIEALGASSTLGAELRLDYDVQLRIHRLTGGQPLLVKDALRELIREEVAKRGDTPQVIEVLEDDVRELENLWRESPQGRAQHWNRQLTTLLKRQPRLIERLDYYASRNTIVQERDLNQQDQALFVAGWIGPDIASERWAIRSIFHEALALRVLGTISNGGLS